MLQKTLEQQMKKMGLTVSKALCEHFDFSRAELAEAVRLTSLDDFDSVLARFGRGGDGCAICKPTVASILSSFRNSYVLDAGPRWYSGDQRPCAGEHAEERYLLRRSAYSCR